MSETTWQKEVCRMLNKRPAVVLERIARGGGETRWFYCADLGGFREIQAKLKPGSRVSLYFDGRIHRDLFTPQVKSIIQQLLEQTGEVLIGKLGQDGIRIEMESLSGPLEF